MTMLLSAEYTERTEMNLRLKQFEKVDFEKEDEKDRDKEIKKRDELVTP